MELEPKKSILCDCPKGPTVSAYQQIHLQFISRDNPPVVKHLSEMQLKLENILQQTSLLLLGHWSQGTDE